MSEQRQRVAVVGLGYVGLPLVREVIRAGHFCIGYDTSRIVRAGLESGTSHVDDVADEEVKQMLREGLTVSGDGSALADADVIVICVPTPLSPDGGPDLTAVEDAARTIARAMRPGQLIVLESTTYPGTTEEVLIPLLEAGGLRAGIDFNCAFSPERIDPGNTAFGLSNTPKVIGGLTDACTRRAVEFYGQFIDEIVTARGPREAEMTKLLENTYRHVNIALVNEMAQFCHELDIDLWDAIRCASTKPFGFQAFFPGPGVGGHCIPIDPNYLSHRVRTHLGHPFRFVELAQEINAGMPAYVARRAQDLLNEESKPVRGSRVALLGVTYKPDIADQRESPAVDLAQALINLGAIVGFHDPFVREWTVQGVPVRRYPSIESALEEPDIVILVQAHSAYDRDALGRSGALLLDTRGVLAGPTVHTL